MYWTMQPPKPWKDSIILQFYCNKHHWSLISWYPQYVFYILFQLYSFVLQTDFPAGIISFGIVTSFVVNIANRCLRGVVEVEVISSSIDIPPSYLNNVFAKAGKTNHSSTFHIVCGQLSVYPGLKMHCYLRVCIPPSQSSWQGVLGEGTKSWPGVRGHKQQCVCAAQNGAMAKINTAL